MSFAVVAGAVVAAGAAVATADSQRRATNQQRDAANAANAQARSQFEQSREDQQPFMRSSQMAIGQINNNLMQPEWSRPFGMDQFQQDAGYQFRLNEGNKALERRSAAGGRFFSGGALKDASRFNQESASQEYNNAFNRFQTDRQGRLNPLLSLAGLGQSSAGQVGQLGAQSSMYQGNNLINAGDAQAAGTIGRSNTINSGMNNMYGALRSWQARPQGQQFNYNYDEQSFL